MTHYAWNKTVAHACVTLPNLTFNVSCATDADGNTQVAAPNLPSFPTRRSADLTVTAVALSDLLITDADTAATVTATITFSEAMDTTSTPTISNKIGRAHA